MNVKREISLTLNKNETLADLLKRADFTSSELYQVADVMSQKINVRKLGIGMNFTIGFDEAAFDESENAARVASHLNTDHTELRVSEADARNVIPILPQLYDEPFADSSQIPTYLVCSAARQNVTVSLSGDGGDEMFGGYNRYILGPWLWRNISRVPGPIRRFSGYLAQTIPEYFWDSIGAKSVSYTHLTLPTICSV